jgi:uncharacterized membrane protein YphA (DoxX/SURF4 family)
MMAVKFRTPGKRNLMVEIISYLFIILFVYAAVSKLLDFEHYKAQIRQSSLLNTYTDYVAWGVPVIEILVSLLFFLPKLRLAGLWASFTLMVIFSTYIIFVLNFADSIPCSCGGVIASLSWSQHLIFNIGFSLLAIFGILLMQKHIQTKKIEPKV